MSIFSQKAYKMAEYWTSRNRDFWDFHFLENFEKCLSQADFEFLVNFDIFSKVNSWSREKSKAYGVVPQNGAYPALYTQIKKSKTKKIFFGGLCRQTNHESDLWAEKTEK